MPVAYQANIVATILAVLNLLDTAPGSWGIGAWDLYHGHLVVPKDPATGLPFPAVVSQVSAFRPIVNRLDALRNLHRPDTLTTPASIVSFTSALATLLADFTTPLNNLLATGVASIFYHSFEFSVHMQDQSRYSPFHPADARRNWLAPLGLGLPTKYASADNPDNPINDFVLILQFSFLMDKAGQIGVVAETKQELIAVTGKPFSEIE